MGPFTLTSVCQADAEMGTARRPSHSPPRITIFLCVSSLMNTLTKLKATGKSLGAETHETPLGSWTRGLGGILMAKGMIWIGVDRFRFCYFLLCDLQLITYPL